MEIRPRGPADLSQEIGPSFFSFHFLILTWNHSQTLQIFYLDPTMFQRLTIINSSVCLTACDTLCATLKELYPNIYTELGASDSMFYPLTMCALQIVFMIMSMIMIMKPSPLQQQNNLSACWKDWRLGCETRWCKIGWLDSLSWTIELPPRNTGEYWSSSTWRWSPQWPQNSACFQLSISNPLVKIYYFGINSYYYYYFLFLLRALKIVCAYG